MSLPALQPILRVSVQIVFEHNDTYLTDVKRVIQTRKVLYRTPVVGDILSATIFLEIGDVKRFPSAQHLASYSGLIPTVHASGGKMRLGRTSAVANHYLRWAFVEAANGIVMRKHLYKDRHVMQLYERLRARKNHGKAAVAVARHLAEASWWMLTRKQFYREPAPASMSSSKNG